MRTGRCGFAVCLSLVLWGGNAIGQSNPSVVTTLVQESSNNTSACSSSTNPAGNQTYCTANFNGFHTNANDTAAETQIPVSPAGHVSNVSIKELLYPGWTGKVLCEYQPWFGASNHKSIGYNENSADTVAAQDSYMLSVGCDVNLIDFYGSLDPGQSFNLATTAAVFADLDNRAGYPLKFGIMEDKGALSATCSTSSTNESATVTCLENALIEDMDYVDSNYATSGAYFTDGGDPVIFSFITQSEWTVLSAADWNTIWSTVKAHTDTYAAPFKYILEFGSFTSATYNNGEYAWMQPPAYNPTEQFWWGSITSLAPSYLDNLYSAGIAHPNQITVGGLWKGFDDNNASWSGNRVIAEQCGQVLLYTANEIAKYFGGSNPQLPYVQIATWNDYEEGTAVEPGIDNCYTVNASISGSKVSWSLVASDTYASPSTIHHFNVYYADASGNLYSAASNISPTTTSLDLSSLVPAGTWTIYVEMVGQPLIINRMSNPVSFGGGVPGITFAPATLSFLPQALNSTSSAQQVTVTNTGAGVLSISGVAGSGEFSVVNNTCTGSIAASSSCSFGVTFTPSNMGSQAGFITVTSNAPGTNTLTLGGSGADFSVNATPGTQTVTAGTAANYTISVPSAGANFANSITLTCNGLPADSTCTFAPASVNAGTPSALTITTRATQTAMLRRAIKTQGSPLLAGWLQFSGFGIVGLALGGTLKRRQRIKLGAIAVALAMIFCFALGCGGVSQGAPNNPIVPGTPSGTYSVTVSASSGSLTHSTALTLVVK